MTLIVDQENRIAGRIDQIIGWAKSGTTRDREDPGVEFYLMDRENVDAMRDHILKVIKAESSANQIAARVEALAENYPEDVFPPDADNRDAISGTAMRHAYQNAARSIREDLVA